MNIKNKSTNRSFGIVFCIVFLIISFWSFFDTAEIRYWSLIIAIIFFILGLLNSKILTPLNLIWFKFGIFLGKFISPIAMAIIFFIVITPISLLLKLFNKYVLNLKNNKDKTYWIKKNGPKSKMKNQF